MNNKFKIVISILIWEYFQDDCRKPGNETRERKVSSKKGENFYNFFHIEIKYLLKYLVRNWGFLTAK
jgi:hypothetical protein